MCTESQKYKLSSQRLITEPGPSVLKTAHAKYYTLPSRQKLLVNIKHAHLDVRLKVSVEDRRNKMASQRFANTQKSLEKF